jgi:hypothetical protein
MKRSRDETEFVKVYRKIPTNEFGQFDSLPNQCGPRERFSVSAMLHLLPVDHTNALYKPSDWIPVIGDSGSDRDCVYRAAVLWGRLFSFVARVTAGYGESICMSVPFDYTKISNDNVYFHEMFRASMMANNRTARGSGWTPADELFHFRRGVEWFLDGISSVYETSTTLFGGNIKVIERLSAYFPPSFEVNWERPSVHRSVSKRTNDDALLVYAFRIRRSDCRSCWKELLSAHLQCHRCSLNVAANSELVELCARPSEVAVVAGGTSAASMSTSMTNKLFQKRELLAYAQRLKKIRDVDPDEREQSANLGYLLKKWGWDEGDSEAIVMVDGGSEIYGSESINREIKSLNAELESIKKQLNNIAERLYNGESVTWLQLAQQIHSDTKNGNGKRVSNDDIEWFALRYDKLPKDFVGEDFGKTKEIVDKERDLKIATKALVLYNEERNKVGELISYIHDNSEEMKEKTKNVDPRLVSRLMKENGSDIPESTVTALYTLRKEISRLSDIAQGETLEVLEMFRSELDETSAADRAVKDAMQLSLRAYNTVFSLTSGTTLRIGTGMTAIKQNVFTATPTEAVSSKFTEFERQVKQRLEQLVGEELTKPQKISVTFDVEDDEFVTAVSRQSYGSDRGAAAIQKSLNKKKDVRSLNGQSTPVSVYFYMGTEPLVQAALGSIESLTDDDRDAMLVFDNIVEISAKPQTSTVAPRPGASVAWLKRIGEDTGATVNQAWVAETMDEELSNEVAEESESFKKFRIVAERLATDGKETNVYYRTPGKTYSSTGTIESSELLTRKEARIVFRFPQSASKAEPLKDAVSTIVQFAYASATLVGAQIGAIYVFNPVRLGVGKKPMRDWCVMIVSERMTSKLLKSEEERELRRASASRNDNKHAEYAEMRGLFLDRLWQLIARMSANGIAFFDSHLDNIMAVPSKDGSFAPRIVDFDARWGTVLRREDLVPAGAGAEDGHPGWRPLYILNVLFVAYQLRLDASRSSMFPLWMALSRPVSYSDRATRAALRMVNQAGQSVSREVHINALLKHEIEYMTVGQHLNVAHKLLALEWKGGFYGNVKNVINPLIPDDKKYNAVDAYEPDNARWLRPNTTIEGGQEQWLTWGAVVKIFDAAFVQLNNPDNPNTLHANLVMRQHYINSDVVRAVLGTPTGSPLTQQQRAIAYNALSRTDLGAATRCENAIASTLNSTFRRLFYFFRRRGVGGTAPVVNLMTLLSEFVFTPTDLLALPGHIDPTREVEVVHHQEPQVPADVARALMKFDV